MLLSSLLVVLGMQLFAIGLLGELIIFTHARDIKDYQIDQVVVGKSHFYDVSANGMTERLPGVTGFLGVINKPALVPWAMILP